MIEETIRVQRMSISKCVKTCPVHRLYKQPVYKRLSYCFVPAKVAMLSQVVECWHVEPEILGSTTDLDTFLINWEKLDKL